MVGDIVILNTGDEIPADGELLDAVTLSVDESTLTGEPICAKTTDKAHFDKDATYPSNHVMRGTKVMEGHGVMRVLKVGDATEMGKVFEEAQIDDSVKTPLNEQLDGLADWITNVSYIFAGTHNRRSVDSLPWLGCMAGMDVGNPRGSVLGSL